MDETYKRTAVGAGDLCVESARLYSFVLYCIVFWSVLIGGT